MLQNVLCISLGASLGALLRWVTGLAFNGLVPLIPLGTLLANLTGGYCIGVMLGVIAVCPQFPEAMRLFIITGFLGALTTFSTFSGEVVLLIQQRHILAALVLIALHLLGSLAMTGFGIATSMLFVRAG